MTPKPFPTHEMQTLLTGLAMGESPRWHEAAFGFRTGARKRLLRSISMAIARW
jgi:hypothetical protein